MSRPQRPRPAKLVVGIFMKKTGPFALVATDLENSFGPIDMISTWFPFNYTGYYESEMGKPLFRRVFVFKKLVEQASLPEIKIKTNALELQYMQDDQRIVNIDPGYMLLERFVLATGKNFAHRIYIGRGIYADLTLIYRKGAFRKLEWTYPDYADENMLVYLEGIRNRYADNLKRLENN
jgi:hypothetical protein